MKKQLLAGALVALLVPLTAPVHADTLDPSVFAATLAPGESITVRKTFTIEDAAPVDAPLDVMFLFDTTSSMNTVIAAARAKAVDILTGLGTFGDLATGVATYRDYPISPFGSPGDYPFALNQDLSLGGAGTAGVISGPATDTGGGNDTPESGLHALSELASGTSWRADSSRFVLHFADAPFHDGDLEGAYPDDTGLADAIDALNAEGVTWIGLDFDSGFSSMDDTGQGTAIAGGTGGSLLDADATDADALAAAIIAAVGEIIDEYTRVGLAPIGAGPEVGVSIECVSADGVDCSGDGATTLGTWTRAVEREFLFDVTFTGLEKTTPHGAPKLFTTVGTVDGAVTARERDAITVVPEPASLALLGLGLAGFGAFARRRVAV